VGGPVGNIALINRDQERQALDQLLEAARAGLSGSLVLRGEPGIGKTALLDYAADRASGMQVARVLAVESEMELGFAALHQLLVPFLGRIEVLPAPQRDALGSAFGLIAADAAAPDRFLVGLAVLTLLSAAAVQQPLLIVVDDAQWLDDVSAEVLCFVARRVYADGIALVFAVREPAGRRALLLLAAADPSGDPALLWRAAGGRGLTMEAAVPAEAERLVTLLPRIAFRHPLIRSAVYHGASATQRRLAHQALAHFRGAITALGASADVRWFMLGCLAAGELWDLDGWHALARRWAALARQRGALTTLPVAMSLLSGAEVAAGRLSASDAIHAEAAEISAATGPQPPGRLHGPAGSGPRSPALRGVAAPPAAPRRGPCAVAHRAGHVRRDGTGRVRRPGPRRTRRPGRAAPRARSGVGRWTPAGEADRAGGADRPGWLPREPPTQLPPRNYSSARAPLTTTSTRYSARLACPPGRSSSGRLATWAEGEA